MPTVCNPWQAGTTLHSPLLQDPAISKGLLCAQAIFSFSDWKTGDQNSSPSTNLKPDICRSKKQSQFQPSTKAKQFANTVVLVHKAAPQQYGSKCI